MRLSKNYPPPPQQQQQSSQFYQPTVPYRLYSRRLLIILLFISYCIAQPQVSGTYAGIPQSEPAFSHGVDYNMPQPQVSSSHGAHYNMSQARPTTSNNTFFSPQTAFYTSSPPQHMFSNQSVSGMEYLSNNPLLNVGFNVVEQGMKDITGKTVNILPNEVKQYFCFQFFSLI